MIDQRPYTIFCDIDGVLFKHQDPCCSVRLKPEILEGTIEKIVEWDSKGYNIILVSGRRESMRKITEKQLGESGIIYDQLILGIGGGKRFIINDAKLDNFDDTAIGITLDRNQGIGDIEL